MLLFKKELNCINPLNIVFLCGNKYSPEAGYDKRNILKKYLLDSNISCQPIILEENFIFAKNSKKYLAYEDIFLNNLSQVEKMASLYADKIFIIHETLSTAAEIGMFAGDESLRSKICILYPDDISIEEKKMSSFIKLAFFNDNDKREDQPKKIKFYPDVEVYRHSLNRSEYHTFFYENRIGDILGRQILSFVNKTNRQIVKIQKARYHKPSSERNILSYVVDKENGKIKAYLYSDALKIQLLSLFTVDKYKSEFRKEKKIKDHVKYINELYENILLNSICDLEGIDTDCFRIKVDLLDVCGCNLRQAIGSFLYMLQAIEFITLEQVSTEDYVNRKIIIKQAMEKNNPQFKKYIYEKTATEFGGII